MPELPSLNLIARGEATPSEARAALVAVFDEPTPELMEDAYLALRAWVWKALDGRQRDSELREWADILDAASALLTEHGQAALAERLTALHELIGESVAVATALATTDVTRLRQVDGALTFLATQEGWAARDTLGAHLGLDRLGLTQVLNVMSIDGLVERHGVGDMAVLRLARGGLGRHAEGRT